MIQNRWPLFHWPVVEDVPKVGSPIRLRVSIRSRPNCGLGGSDARRVDRLCETGPTTTGIILIFRAKQGFSRNHINVDPWFFVIPVLILEGVRFHRVGSRHTGGGLVSGAGFSDLVSDKDFLGLVWSLVLALLMPECAAVRVLKSTWVATGFI